MKNAGRADGSCFNCRAIAGLHFLHGKECTGFFFYQNYNHIHVGINVCFRAAQKYPNVTDTLVKVSLERAGFWSECLHWFTKTTVEIKRLQMIRGRKHKRLPGEKEPALQQVRC